MIISENDRCYEIRQEAINLLKVHNFDTSTAIDIRELIASTGKPITIKITDLRGITGFTCLNTKNNSYRMFFDEMLISGCPARLNFTAAHELGHIILNHFTDIDNSIIMNYVKEREANVFVDELLMPTSQILRHRMSAREICDTYNVSVTASQNKIKYLNSNVLYQQQKQKETIYRIISRSPSLFSDTTYDYNSSILQLLEEDRLVPILEGDLP